VSPRRRYVPDERVFGRHYRGRPWLIGLAVVLVGALALLLGYTKHIPFTGHGYELKAVFRNSPVVQPNSPVRIAGVTVGKVISTQPKGNANEITFTVGNDGQPVHDDAQVAIRPRLFLEGNFFLDLKPGSPSAPGLSSGGVIGVANTSTAVQLDQVLGALRAPERSDLRAVLQRYGGALTHVPTAAENSTQVPRVRGLTAAGALNDSFRYGAKAGKSTALVATALLGLREHDLSSLIGAQSRVFGALVSREAALKDLIVNLNTTLGAFASRSTALAATIHELAPTLAEARPALRHLNASFPALRAFAIDVRPGVEQLPATIHAGLPWLRQAGALLRPSELGTLAQLVRRAAPATARAVDGTSGFLPQLGLASRCASDVLVPAGNAVLRDPRFGTGEPNFREFFYSLVDVAAGGQAFDGNGSMLRLQAGGGPQLVSSPNPGGGPLNSANFGHNISAPLGTQPAFQHQGRPPFRPDFACFRNPLPAVNGPASTVAAPDPKAVP
jgi:phospholipid/cholesterol/gamma-HCH transport system substrate-binding protein